MQHEKGLEEANKGQRGGEVGDKDKNLFWS
jgi:hypothetical protein